MVSQRGTARSFSSTDPKLAGPPPFVKGPNYAAAWKALMGMATPEMKAMMAKAMNTAGGPGK